MLFMQHILEPRDLLFYLVTQMSRSWHFTLTHVGKQTASELWMCAGVGDSTRYIPLHLISERKPELCSVLPAIHILTGCYTTSIVGTKLSALQPPATQLLSEFGKSLSSPNQDEIIRKAVQYLVQVLKHNSTCTTMDILRYEMYHQRKVSDLHSLLPTSADFHLHILRCLYTQPIHRCTVFKT